MEACVDFCRLLEMEKGFDRKTKLHNQMGAAFGKSRTMNKSI
jgi:hypothetical protein